MRSSHKLVAALVKGLAGRLVDTFPSLGPLVPLLGCMSSSHKPVRRRDFISLCRIMRSSHKLVAMGVFSFVSFVSPSGIIKSSQRLAAANGLVGSSVEAGFTGLDVSALMRSSHRLAGTDALIGFVSVDCSAGGCSSSFHMFAFTAESGVVGGSVEG